MFTSRAEYRLLLRQDNCDLRLTPAAADLGIVDSYRTNRTREKAETLASAHKFARETNVDGLRVEKWMRRPENTWPKLPEDIRSRFTPAIWDLIETDLKYSGYLDRQSEAVVRASRMEDRAIPASFDYTAFKGLKREAQLKLTSIRPCTLGQAARIQGVTPADIALLTVMLERGQPGDPAVATS
jgi:tRNA uridine 5-carboxymethylaminomethyl modification enzyme